MRALPWLVTALLLGTPDVQAANWFELEALGAGSGLDIEVDTDSLHQAGTRRTITVRMSYPEPRLHASGNPFRSVVVTVDVDCEGQLAGYRDATFHAEAKGQGPVTGREPGRLAPGTDAAGVLLPAKSAESLIRAACARPTPAVP